MTGRKKTNDEEKIILIARLKVKADKVEEAKSAALAVVAESPKRSGLH